MMVLIVLSILLLILLCDENMLGLFSKPVKVEAKRQYIPPIKHNNVRYCMEVETPPNSIREISLDTTSRGITPSTRQPNHTKNMWKFNPTRLDVTSELFDVYTPLRTSKEYDPIASHYVSWMGTE